MKTKSKTLAGLLGIFLGGYGIHSFYLGETKKGILHICLTLASFVLFLLSFAFLKFLGVIMEGGIVWPTLLYLLWLAGSCVPSLAGFCWAIYEAFCIFTGRLTADASGVPLV